MHVIKILNINSKLSGLEVKMQTASFPLKMLSFRVVPHLHDSQLVFVLCLLGFEASQA